MVAFVYSTMNPSSRYLGVNAADITDESDGIKIISKKLQNRKVLVVLDDVYDPEQIGKLAGEAGWFREGSRIIITSRNKNAPVFEGGRVEIFEAEPMKFEESLLLFSRHAFGKENPAEDFHGLSEKAVRITGGLPLALEVVGSKLRTSDRGHWNHIIGTLQKIPEKKVEDRLKIGYDALRLEVKEIFLDIACFFINEKKTKAMYMWQACDFEPELAVQELVNACLVKLTNENRFWMHDQLRDLGRKLIRDERLKHHGKPCSRIWMHEDALKVLQDEEGTNLHLKNLVVLDLSESSVSETWAGWRHIGMCKELKVLDLRRCDHLTETPDLSMCTKLERLILKGCINLAQIDHSVGKLKCLKYLNASGCIHIREIPREVCCLDGLVDIVMIMEQSFNCSYKLPDSIERLERLQRLCVSLGRSRPPSSLGDLKSLTMLVLSRSEIAELPESIGGLVKLEFLSLFYCKDLKKLPNSIGSLKSLVELNISMSGIVELPDEVVNLQKLKVIDMRGCDIRRLPDFLGNLEKLERLDVFSCNFSEAVPSAIKGITSSLKVSSSAWDKSCYRYWKREWLVQSMQIPTFFHRWQGYGQNNRHCSWSRNGSNNAIAYSSSLGSSGSSSCQQAKQQQQQLPTQLQAHQMSQLHPMNEMKIRPGMGVKPGVFQQHHSVTGQRPAYPCQQLKLGSSFPIFSPQLLQAVSPQIPQHSSPQIDQQDLLTSVTKTGTPLQSASSPFACNLVEANHVLKEEIREINQQLIDIIVDISDEDVDPTAAAAVAEGGEGVVSPIQPLRLLVPSNYLNCSPVLLDKFPVEVSKEYEDLSAKAKSRFSISLRRLSQLMSLKDIARTWDNCSRAVILEYAEQSGGGSFSSNHRGLRNSQPHRRCWCTLPKSSELPRRSAFTPITRSWATSSGGRLEVVLCTFLLCRPQTTLKPKIVFFIGNGFRGPLFHELILRNPNTYTLRRNIEFCLSEGVTPDGVSKFMVNQPRAAVQTPERMVSAVELVKRMGIEPKSGMFIHALLRIMLSMNEANWNHKVEVLKSLRLRQRQRVLEILLSKGLLQVEKSNGWIYTLPEKCFLRKDIVKNLNEIPDLMEIYRGSSDKEKGTRKKKRESKIA
ncbi:hypothetical protein CRG98_045715 [Punica granatum]|uniref:Uncharacterized protein n=1 Tax=Punica granatum TaxID=22663 RepID=A0A2I0HQ93_PUNGR|nr:hypothetical protein CRG98_045715 [Punica granatum]